MALSFLPDNVSVKRRVDSWMWSTLTEIIQSLDCNIQPVTPDDLLYDIEYKKYIMFIETDDRFYLQWSDLITDQDWIEYKVDSIDRFKGPVKSTMEIILIESKDD